MSPSVFSTTLRHVVSHLNNDVGDHVLLCDVPRTAVVRIQVRGKCVQPAVADREAEASSAAGLYGPGMGGAMGQRGTDNALRFLPGKSNSLFADTGRRPMTMCASGCHICHQRQGLARFQMDPYQ